MQERRKYLYSLLLIMLLAALLRLFAIDGVDIWFDEAVSIMISDNLPGDIIAGSPTVTVNPPLYYLLLHYWRRAFPGVCWGRCLSVLLGLAGTLMIYLVGLRLASPGTALLAALFYAVSPFQIYYSQEMRMYSLLSFISLAIIYYTVGVMRLNRPIDWTGLTVAGAAGLYSHYFAAIVLGVSLIIIALMSRRRRSLIIKTVACGLLIASCFAPWVPSFLNNTGEVYQVRSAEEDDALRFNLPLALAGTVKSFSVGNEQTVSFADGKIMVALIIPGMLLYSIIFAAGIRERKRNKNAIIPVIYTILPLAVVALISLRMNLYLNRYLIIANAPFYLVAAMGLAGMARKRFAVPLVISSLLAISLLSTFNRSLRSDYRREDFRGAFQYIATNVHPGDMVLHPSMFTLYPFKVYDKEMNSNFLLDADGKSGTSQGLITFNVLGGRDLSSLKNQRIWWIEPACTGRLQASSPWYNLDDQAYDLRLTALKNNGFSETDRQRFRGITVVLVERPAAKIFCGG